MQRRTLEAGARPPRPPASRLGRTALAIAVVALPALARAVPDAPTCYSPDPAAGWAGPSTAIGCVNCSGCTGPLVATQYQLRADPGSWATPLVDVTDPDAGRFWGMPAGLAHLSGYCVRVRYADATGWGPYTADVCFTYDDVPPSGASGVSVTAQPHGEVRIEFQPASDQGGGVEGYRALYRGAWSQVAVEPFGHASASPVVDVLGPGTWTVALEPIDRAQNVGPRSPATPVTITAAPGLPAPPAPTVATPVRSSSWSGELSWETPDAGSYLLSTARDDGGWAPSNPPRTRSSHRDLYLGSDGTWRIRVAAVYGSETSEWSPEATVLLDSTAPTGCTPPVAVPGLAGAVQVSWSACQDTLSGVASYVLERDRDGAGWSQVAKVASPPFDDALPSPGVFTWRVRAVDVAGNACPPTQPSNAVANGPDAGMPLDAALPPDATVPPDAAEPRDASVPLDASVPPDAGAPFDAACGPDAATPGAGPFLFSVACQQAGGASGGVWLLLLSGLGLAGRSRSR